jgi:hypothetical protein
MSSLSTELITTWTHRRQNHALNQYHLIESFVDSERPSFLVLPNNFDAELSLVRWCEQTFGGYALYLFNTPNFTVPTQFLPKPMQKEEIVLPYHSYTPLPTEFRAGRLQLSVHVQRLRSDELFPSHSYLFSLPHALLRGKIGHRICQHTKLRLSPTTRINYPYRKEVLEYCIIGSLGLYKERLDQEVLLLMAEDVEDDHTFKYVRLRVHPTHVGVDVNLLLTHDAEWQQQMHDALEKWDLEDNKSSYEDKMTLVEFLYARFVVSLRAQHSV